MELKESRDRASACMVDLIEYVRAGGDVEGIEQRMETLDVPEENLDDAIDLILMDIFGTATHYVRDVLPAGCSEDRIRVFISVTSGVIEQVAGVDRSYGEAFIDYVLGRGPRLPDSYNDIACYLAYCALLGPVSRDDLIRDRATVREAAELSGKLGR